MTKTDDARIGRGNDPQIFQKRRSVRQPAAFVKLNKTIFYWLFHPLEAKKNPQAAGADGMMTAFTDS